MYLCLIITIDRERSTLLITVNNGNTFCVCVYFAANVAKLSQLLVILMGQRWFSMFNIFPQPRSHTKIANSCIRHCN